jgi:hypothetical protein
MTAGNASFGNGIHGASDRPAPPPGRGAPCGQANAAAPLRAAPVRPDGLGAPGRPGVQVASGELGLDPALPVPCLHAQHPARQRSLAGLIGQIRLITRRAGRRVPGGGSCSLMAGPPAGQGFSGEAARPVPYPPPGPPRARSRRYRAARRAAPGSRPRNAPGPSMAVTPAMLSPIAQITKPARPCSRPDSPRRAYAGTARRPRSPSLTACGPARPSQRPVRRHRAPLSPVATGGLAPRRARAAPGRRRTG